MSDENISAKGLKEPVYSHKTHGLTRAELFHRFDKQFETYMGSQVGTIGATLISQHPKYDKMYYWYKMLIRDTGYDIESAKDQARPPSSTNETGTKSPLLTLTAFLTMLQPSGSPLALSSTIGFVSGLRASRHTANRA